MSGRAHKVALFHALLLPLLAAAAGVPTGLQHDVVFDAYTPLAGNAERLRRLTGPLSAWHLQQRLQTTHQTLSEQSIDLRGERFALYVPPHAPASGYGLLVFVPPWNEARIPQEWISTLNHRSIIFVSAARSGNDQDVLNRREPLTILAAYNVMHRYPVDAQRVYVGGFSGGSRVALRLALAYPDVFRGALLEAGSDPIGTAEIPLPPVDLMRRFQQDSRLVYLTGEEDAFHLAQDARSRDSLQAWCVFDTDVQPMPRTSHGIADGGAFSRAVNSLERRSAPDPGKLAACRQHNRQTLDSRLRQARSLVDRNRADDARKLLEEIDAQYGALAAPESVELMQKIEAAH
jgi:predicted esterase